MVTQEFRNALKIHPEPKHRLAWKIGISPSSLSHIVHGHQRVEPGDKRLLRIAKLINFPEEKIFEKERSAA